MTIHEKYKLSVYKDIVILSENNNKKIYIVRDENTNKMYVKKIFNNFDNFNFYKRLSMLQHKNLVTIHDVIKSGNKIYIIEDYINGQTLKSLLEHCGSMEESEALNYILQLCDVLIYLHSQNPPIIHRDIKP